MTEKTRAVLHSSQKDDWGTPQWLFQVLHVQYRFTLDLCASAENALLPRFCTQVQSARVCNGGTLQPLDWTQERFFANPPYGRQWPKILASIPQGAQGVFLLPSRTGSRWFHKMINDASWLVFFKGRLKFRGAITSAPFDSVLFGYSVPRPKGVEGKFIDLLH